MGIAEKDSAMDVLAEVPKALRALLAENTKLASELEGYQRRAKAEDIVAAMDAKGLGDKSAPFQEKVAKLLSSEKDLDTVKEAVELATPDMNFATVSDDGHESSDPFEDYILGTLA